MMLTGTADAFSEVLPEALRSRVNSGYPRTVGSLPEQIHLSIGSSLSLFKSTCHLVLLVREDGVG